MKPKAHSPFLRSALAFAGALVITPTLFAANLYWDADTTLDGIQEGSGIWSSTVAQFSQNTSPYTPVIPVKGTDAIIFGNGAGPAGYTITVDEALNYADTTNSSLTFNRDYTLSGSGSLAAGNVAVATGATANIGIALTGGTGTKTWSVNSGATLNLSGGGTIQNLSGTNGTINFKGGTYTVPGVTWGSGSQGLTVNISNGSNVSTSNFKIGTDQNNALSRTDVTITNATVTASDNTTIGSSNGVVIGTATLTVGSGGVINAGTTKFIVGSGGDTTNNKRYGSNAELNINGGTYNQTANSGNAKIFLATNESSVGATSSTVNITNGGVVTTNGIQFGDNGMLNRDFSVGSTATVNVTNSTLNLGGNGIGINGSQNNITRSINLNNATLAVATGTTGFTSAAGININLTNTSKFVALSGATITINSVIAGTGGIDKRDVGTLSLAGTNTFSGGINVTEGTVTTTTTGDFGASDISVSTAGTLRLANINGQAIADTAALYFETGSTLVFVNSGTDTVGSIQIGTNTLAAGDYNATQLTSYGINASGTGVLRVVPVPEPSAILFGALSLSGLVFRRDRKKL